MIDVKKFKEDGYLYDSLENYTELIPFADMQNVKSLIDEKNIKRYSKYDYWYKYNNQSYMEEINYVDFLKRDKDLKVADYVYEKSHEYMIKKIEECGFYPTWVFGTSMHEDIDKILNGETIRNFQLNFVKKYYSEKKWKNYFGTTRLQFYDKDCEIKLHDDGKSEQRICVFLYFLNNEWSQENGGHLILHTDNDIIKINPVFPNFVVLDSDKNLFHEVEKVNKDMKYNIVSFYMGIS